MTTETEKNREKDDEGSLVEAICVAIERMMEKIMTKKSPKERASFWCHSHNQSQKRSTFDSVFYNLITGKQRLPARPRDVRLNLAEKERTIDWGELSDVLAKLVALNIIDGHRDNFPLPRGRPNRELSPEYRGRNSYYVFSDLKNLISEVLKDPSMITSINGRLVSNKQLYGFLKYSYACIIHQAKQNEHSFQNTFRPYGMTEQQLELNGKREGPRILFKDISDKKLEQLAGAYAKRAIENLESNRIPIIYLVAILLDIGQVYE